MSGRERVLSRVRAALRRAPAAAPAGTRPRLESVLPAVGASPAECLDLFARRAAELRAGFEVHRDVEGIGLRLCDLAHAEGWRRVATHAGALTDLLAPRLGVPVLAVDRGYATRELESCDAGLTECEALVAQTGSVLVTSRGAGGRALSVLPPHHVVVATASQLVPDLPAAFERLAARCGGRWPSLASFITGPSRTGDIERILVLGAHGPRQLTVLLLAQASDEAVRVSSRGANGR